ncbi:MAG: septal ring lytic transglycosylase RlpA family protein, partial [Gammaproteobacteria bacterium]
MNGTTRRLGTAALCLLLASIQFGCASTPRGGASAGSATERSPHGNPPFYEVFGRRYYVLDSAEGYVERGIASWYGREFHRRRTSSGEMYDMHAMTAAHKTLPLPSYARVTRVATGKSIVVRVNDRGPFHDGRIIDLSYVAAYKLGILQQGSDEVIVERIMPDEIRRWNPAPDPAPMLADASAAPPAEAMPVAPAPTAAPASVA